MNLPVEDNSLRMDIMLHNSIRKAQKMYGRYLAYHSIKTILLAIFIGIDFKQQPRFQPFNALVLATVVGGCYMLVYIAVLCVLQNSSLIMQIGQSIGHVGYEPYSGVVIQGRINSRVASTVYDFANPQFEYTEQQKNQIQTNLGQILAQTIIQQQCLLRTGISLLNMCSIALIIYFIYFLATRPTQGTLKGVLIAYVVLEALSKIQVIIVLFIVALLPIIFIAMCCICCCCKPASQGEQVMPQIPTIQYSPTLNIQQNQCRICFQNFAIGDKVQILPCDTKHVFHQFCIGSWFKVSNTCPMCRRNIAQLGAVQPPNPSD